MNWTIGEIEIFQIVELKEAGKLIQSTIRKATPANIRKTNWLFPHFADEEGNLKAYVQSFLIKSGGKNILIDTCCGNGKNRPGAPDWSNLKTSYLDRLHETNVGEEDIDIVLCTHIHFDHVGWNIKLEGGKWIPTFPNAKYLFAKEEYKYWEQKPEKEMEDDKLSFDDSVSPIIKDGLAHFVESNHKIDQNISLVSTPGHTPGHVSVLIESQDKKAIISGDFLHHPCQIANPQWTMDADTLPEVAFKTRKKMLNEIADSQTLLIGSHFANPVAGWVINVKDSFIFKV